MLGNQAFLPLLPSHSYRTLYSRGSHILIDYCTIRNIYFYFKKMAPDGLNIGVLASLHDAGLAWWTQDEVLQERTALSIVIHVHCFWRGGDLSTNIYPSFQTNKIFRAKRVLFRKKTNDVGTKWINQRKEKTIVFLLNERIFHKILKEENYWFFSEQTIVWNKTIVFNEWTIFLNEKSFSEKTNKKRWKMNNNFEIKQNILIKKIAKKRTKLVI